MQRSYELNFDKDSQKALQQISDHQDIAAVAEHVSSQAFQMFSPTTSIPNKVNIGPNDWTEFQKSLRGVSQSVRVSCIAIAREQKGKTRGDEAEFWDDLAETLELR